MSKFGEKRERPSELAGSTQRVMTGYGKVYVNINVDEDGDPFEIFITTGQSGGLYNAFCEALAKTISHDLRTGGRPDEIANDLLLIRSDRVAEDNGDRIWSIPDAVGIAMKRFIEDKQGESVRGDNGGPLGVED